MGWRTIRKGRYKGIKIKYKKGFMEEIINPKGFKKPIAISQRGNFTGFTAHYTTRPYRMLTRARSAEKLAIKLAKRGHKRVTFWD